MSDYKKIKVGTRSVECFDCKGMMLVVRVGRQMCDFLKTHRVTCYCATCNTTRNENIRLAPPIKKAAKKKPQKKQWKRLAGLEGRTVGKGRFKEWHFTYPARIDAQTVAPFLFILKKDVWGDWCVWWGEMRLASDKTQKAALEHAKLRMENRGYQLATNKGAGK